MCYGKFAIKFKFKHYDFSWELFQLDDDGPDRVSDGPDWKWLDAAGYMVLYDGHGAIGPFAYIEGDGV